MDYDEKIVVLKKTRLDKYLTSDLNCTRSQISRAIKDRVVYLNGVLVTKGGVIVEEGDVIVVNNMAVEDKNHSIEINFDVTVVYEDSEVMLLDKPINLVVHPASSLKGEATLVDWLRSKSLKLSNIYGKQREGIVHRLDRVTTGAILVAKSNEAHISLSNQLKDRSMGRYYLAIINRPIKENIIVDKPIQRNPKNRLKMDATSGGRASKTEFIKLLESINSKYELILCKLYSGRTHQIRVHLSTLNRYVINDPLYGIISDDNLKGIYLHAYYIYFYSLNGELIKKVVPIPKHLKDFLSKNFDLGDFNEDDKLQDYIFKYINTDL